MVLYGLTVLVFDATGSSTVNSILILTFLTPAVLFSAVAGVYVDRIDRRKVLVVTNLLRAALFLRSRARRHEHRRSSYVLNVAISIDTMFFAPAELSMIPLVVPQSQLTAANGIFLLTLNAAFAIGFAVLGPARRHRRQPDGPDRRRRRPLPRGGRVLLDAAVGAARPIAGDDAGHADAARRWGRSSASCARGSPTSGRTRSSAGALIYLGVAASIVGVLGRPRPGVRPGRPRPAVAGLRRRRAAARRRRRASASLGVNASGRRSAATAAHRDRAHRAGDLRWRCISIAGPIAQLLRDVDDRRAGAGPVGVHQRPDGRRGDRLRGRHRLRGRRASRPRPSSRRRSSRTSAAASSGSSTCSSRSRASCRSSSSARSRTRSGRCRSSSWPRCSSSASASLSVVAAPRGPAAVRARTGPVPLGADGAPPGRPRAVAARRAVSPRPRVAVVFTGGTISMTVDAGRRRRRPDARRRGAAGRGPRACATRGRRPDRPRADAGQPLHVRRRPADPAASSTAPWPTRRSTASSSCRGPTPSRRRPSPGTSATATSGPSS